MLRIELQICLLVAALSSIQGFRAFGSSSRSNMRSTNSLRMGKDLDPDVGYDLMGTLTRQGPVPLFIRLAQPETYAQAVDKFQRKKGCTRLEAQASMDAYFADPNGFLGDEVRVQKGLMSPRDYVNVNQSPFNLVLTAIWAVGITGLFFRIYQVQVLGL